MNDKTSSVILVAMVVAAILGGIAGYYLPDVMLSIGFVGKLFLNALRIIVIPLIVASVIIGVTAIGQMKKISRACGKTVLYFLATSSLAVLLGLALVYLIQPGAGATSTGISVPPELTRIGSFSPVDAVASLLPDSLILAAAEGRFLGLIIFAILFGAVLAGMGARGRTVVELFRGVNEAIMKLVQLLLYVAPVGVFSLVGAVMAENAFSADDIFSSLFGYSVTLLAAFLVHALVVLPLILWLLGNRSPFAYLGKMLPAISTAWSTSSSAATLPVTYDCVIDKNKVDSRASSLALPLGAMINTNGTALYLTVAAVFLAQLYGVGLSAGQILILAACALVVSLGSSVIPHASLFMLAVVIHAADFPVEAYAGIGLLLSVDWFFDRWRAAVNVWGDAVGAAVVSETFDFKTARKVAPVPSRPRLSMADRRGRSEHAQRLPSKVETARSRPPERRVKDSRAKEGRRERQKGVKVRAKTQGREYHRASKPPYQKPRERQPSPFEMSSEPAHALESESPPVTRQPDRTPPRATSKQRQQKETEIKEPFLSREAVEREKARMAGILRSMKAKEKQVELSEERPPTDVPAGGDSESPLVESTPTEERASYPKIDFPSVEDSAETPPLEPGDRSAAEAGSLAEAEADRRVPEEVSAGSESSEGAERAPVHSDVEAEDRPSVPSESSSDTVEYGRSRSRRGWPVKDRPPESEESVPAADADRPGYSTENIEFGRTKRKK